jgi:hypothetical protein
MKTEPLFDKETHQLIIAVILIGVGIAMITRGSRQGNILLGLGVTLISRYFSLEQRIEEFTEGVFSIITPKQV